MLESQTVKTSLALKVVKLTLKVSKVQLPLTNALSGGAAPATPTDGGAQTWSTLDW